MARRNLVNIDEKILRETIRIGAEAGINNIPARKIAKNCDITDATVFEHFQTKENLILQAKLFIDKNIEKIQSSIKMNESEYISSVKEAWLACFRYLIENPIEAKFYDRFRHSEYYKPTISVAKDGYLQKIYHYLTSVNPEIKEYEFAFQVIWAHIVETTINVAMQIAEGKMKYNDQTTEFVYKLIFGGIIEGIRK